MLNDHLHPIYLAKAPSKNDIVASLRVLTWLLISVEQIIQQQKGSGLKLSLCATWAEFELGHLVIYANRDFLVDSFW